MSSINSAAGQTIKSHAFSNAISQTYTKSAAATVTRSYSEILLKLLGNRAMQILAAIGNCESLQMLLHSQSQDVDLQDEDRQTPLHLAALNDHADVADLLIREGASVDIPDGNRWSPLHIAALKGHLGVAELLTRAGAAVCTQDVQGRSPLHLAAEGGHTQIAAALLQRGGDPDLRDSNGQSPLHTAVLNKHLDTVSLLIAFGADVNAQNSLGKPPLHTAVLCGSLEALEVLIKSLADVDLRDSDGNTALHMAAKTFNSTASELLLKAGASEGIANDDLETPSELGRLCQMREKCINLTKKPRDLSRSGEPGEEPEHDAEFSAALSQAMFAAGFRSEFAKMQSGAASVLEEILRRRYRDDRIFVFGSFSDGWGSCMSGINGKIDPDSDIDITFILSRKPLCLRGMEASCQAACSHHVVEYHDGHLLHAIDSKSPNLEYQDPGKTLHSVDLIKALPCCGYPPIDVLQTDRRSHLSASTLQALQAELLAPTCHCVSASTPEAAAAPSGSTGQMRLSTTLLERIVLRNLTTIQGQFFILLKFLIKKVINKQVNGLKTYVAKNLLFYMLEETPAEAWKPESLLALLRRSLQMLVTMMESSGSEHVCMTHFFLRDAAVYLKKEHDSKAGIISELGLIRSNLSEVLAPFQQNLAGTNADGNLQGAIEFHPFLAIHVITAMHEQSAYSLSELQGDGQEPIEYHQIYDVIQLVIDMLHADSHGEVDAVRAAMRLIDRIPDCARTAREFLRVMALIKFEQPESEALEQLAGIASMGMDMGIPCGDWNLSVDEAKTLAWLHLQTEDSALKFAFERRPAWNFSQLPQLLQHLIAQASVEQRCLYLDFHRLTAQLLFIKRPSLLSHIESKSARAIRALDPKAFQAFEGVDMFGLVSHKLRSPGFRSAIAEQALCADTEATERLVLENRRQLFDSNKLLKKFMKQAGSKLMSTMHFLIDDQRTNASAPDSLSTLQSTLKQAITEPAGAAPLGDGEQAKTRNMMRFLRENCPDSRREQLRFIESIFADEPEGRADFDADEGAGYRVLQGTLGSAIDTSFCTANSLMNRQSDQQPFGSANPEFFGLLSDLIQNLTPPGEPQRDAEPDAPSAGGQSAPHLLEEDCD